MSSSADNVVIHKQQTLLAMVRGGVGSQMFRHLYAEVGGEKKDILDNGDLSCAFFVSCLLHNVQSIEAPHATVNGLVKDMEASGWEKIDTVTPGAVIVWEKEAQAGDEEHEHIGIALSAETAVSNSYKEKCPVEHHVTFGTNEDGTPKRKIVSVYKHEAF